MYFVSRTEKNLVAIKLIQQSWPHTEKNKQILKSMKQIEQKPIDRLGNVPIWRSACSSVNEF